MRNYDLAALHEAPFDALDLPDESTPSALRHLRETVWEPLAVPHNEEAEPDTAWLARLLLAVLLATAWLALAGLLGWALKLLGRLAREVTR